MGSAFPYVQTAAVESVVKTCSMCINWFLRFLATQQMQRKMFVFVTLANAIHMFSDIVV